MREAFDEIIGNNRKYNEAAQIEGVVVCLKKI